MNIAITRLSEGKYRHYHEWLSRFSHDITFIEMEKIPNPLIALEKCQGLLLPGGSDVAPEYFKRTDKMSLCAIDTKRDELEFQLFNTSRELRLPVLGICRGLQLVNVALGGNLVLDLPSTGIRGHGKLNGEDQEHDVFVEKGSNLYHLVGKTSGRVNTAHHQCADVLAADLRVTARSADDVVEAIEWNEPTGKPYLMLVQWHPERIAEIENPFSEAIARDFLHAMA